MATKDFSSKQIRVSQLLASGGIAGTSAGMAIYSASNANNLEGGISDGAIFNNVGSDVFLFVSGTANVTTSDRANVTLFGGDVVVSGTIYAERQVIEVDETTSGSLSVSGSLYVKQGAQINLEQGVSFPANTFQVSSNQGSAFAVYGSPSDVDVSQPAVYVNPANAQIDFFVKTDNAKSAIVVDAQREYIAFMSGGLDDSPNAINPRLMSDTNFFASGSIGSKDGSTRGTAVFGGDVVVSGSLHGGSPLQIGEYQSDVGTDVVLYVSGTTPAGGGGKGTPSGTTVLNSDLVVSGTYRGGYDPSAGAESFQAVADNYVFVSNDADFGDPQIEATDSNFFFTGSIGSRGGGTPGTAVFGGDVVVSGSLIAEEQIRGKETYTLGPFYRQLSSTTEGIANYSNSTLDTASPNGDSWQHSHQWVAPCSGTLRAVSCMSYGTPGSAGNPTPSKVIFAMRKNIFFGGAYPEPTTHFSASMRDNSGIRVGAISNGISAVFNAVDGGSTPATDSDYGAIEQTISGSAPFSFAPGDIIFLSVKPETSQAGWYFTCNFILELETQKIK